MELKYWHEKDLMVADVAHGRQDWATSRKLIDKGISLACRLNVKGIKIIYGRGDVIRPNARRYLKEYAEAADNRTLVNDRNNDGASILYFNA